MKAVLYKEEAQPIDEVNLHNLATADAKPAKVEAPKQSYYIVNYKTMGKATLIALAIFVVWVIAEFVLA